MKIIKRYFSKKMESEEKILRGLGVHLVTIFLIILNIMFIEFKNDLKIKNSFYLNERKIFIGFIIISQIIILQSWKYNLNMKNYNPIDIFLNLDLFLSIHFYHLVPFYFLFL